MIERMRPLIPPWLDVVADGQILTLSQDNKTWVDIVVNDTDLKLNDAELCAVVLYPAIARLAFLRT